MSLHKSIFISFGLGALLTACGSDKTQPTGTGGAPGNGPGTCGTDCVHIDYSCYENMPTVSFKTDLLPMFGLACVQGDCHGAYENAPRAGLNLGYKCTFDTNAKWKCTFPTAPDPSGDMTKPAPDDPILATIYASVTGVAATVTDGSVKRVVPGDPANSFLMLKLADQQNSMGYTCMNQDPSHETPPAPKCGVSMPQSQELYCQGAYRPRFDAIATWIAQGAPNN
jgi:hypothetical protein